MSTQNMIKPQLEMSPSLRACIPTRTLTVHSLHLTGGVAVSITSYNLALLNAAPAGSELRRE